MLLPLLCLVAAITLPPPSSTNFADGAALLTDNERAAVVEQLQTIKRERAVTVGVLTVDQLDDDPKAVSVRTLNYWQMGPDSVLLLISMNPRKIYLQPGTNLAYLFDNHNSSAITNSMVPFMKREDTLGALTQALTVIDSTLKTVGMTTVVPTSKPESTKEVQGGTTTGAPNIYTEKSNAGDIALGLTVFVVVGVGIFLLALLMRASKKRRYDALDVDTGYAPLRTPSVFIPPASIAPVYEAEKMIPIKPAPSTHTTKRQYSPPPVPPVVQQTVVVESPVPVIIETPAPVRTYTPPPAPRYSPPKPRYSPPSFSSDSGGGGSDWGSSSDFGSSDGGGGGGSDF